MNATPASSEVVSALRAKLTEYDLFVIADGSGSMKLPYKAGSTTSRWNHMQETLSSLTKFACEIDSDGIGIVIFNDGKIITHENVTTDKAATIFDGLNPTGSTPMGKALKTVLGMAGSTDKKDLIIVFTDGEPDNENDVVQTIVEQSKKQQKDNDCTFLFVQVGDDGDATAFLQRLDDDLVGRYGAKFDIVDVKTETEVNQFGSFEELLANAIVD